MCTYDLSHTHNYTHLLFLSLPLFLSHTHRHTYTHTHLSLYSGSKVFTQFCLLKYIKGSIFGMYCNMYFMIQVDSFFQVLALRKCSCYNMLNELVIERHFTYLVLLSSHVYYFHLLHSCVFIPPRSKEVIPPARMMAVKGFPSRRSDTSQHLAERDTAAQ